MNLVLKKNFTKFVKQIKSINLFNPKHKNQRHYFQQVMPISTSSPHPSPCHTMLVFLVTLPGRKHFHATPKSTHSPHAQPWKTGETKFPNDCLIVSLFRAAFDSSSHLLSPREYLICGGWCGRDKKTRTSFPGKTGRGVGKLFDFARMLEIVKKGCKSILMNCMHPPFQYFFIWLCSIEQSASLTRFD